MLEALFQGGDLLRLAGILSALLGLIAFVPYALDTLRGQTHPQRASWLIWSVLGSIALASQIAEGATDSLGFAAIKVGGTLIIFGLAIVRGRGAFVKWGEAWILVAAALGLLLWFHTHEPAYALAISISISLLGGVATIRQAYRSPHTETMFMWLTSFMAAGCAIVAVGRLDIMLLAYPAYLLVLNGGIVVALLLGRSRAPTPVFRHVGEPRPAPGALFRRTQPVAPVAVISRITPRRPVGERQQTAA